MDTYFTVMVSLSVTAIITFLVFRRKDGGKKLPPGPSILSSHLLLLTTSLPELQPILKSLMSKYGPLITLSVGFHRLIFVNSRSLTHQILIQNGDVFSDRPRFFRFCSISSASYGPTWRLLRRNLASEFLQPSRVKSFSSGRKWVLGNLIARLIQEQQKTEGVVKVVDHFEHAMFHLVVLMCFGKKLDDGCINNITSIQRRLLSLVGSWSFNVYTVSPRLWKILFRKRRNIREQVRNDQKQIFIPLIKSRLETVGDEQIVAYIDTLMKLQLPDRKDDATNENGGNLTVKEMVNLCGEFLNLGTETSISALEWIMANLVKNPDIQKKLYDEIVAVVGPPSTAARCGLAAVINEDEIQKMWYLKAVVLEGLRRHPPGHMVLPHRAMKDVEVQGYVIPQGATINFMAGEMGLDPTVWDNPMEFKPERFLFNDGNSNDNSNDNGNGVFDISGSKGIKMMPFGAGRRMCPASDLALLHLEYFVANLIWYFHWSVPGGYNVDLSEKLEFTIVMKNPLLARITSRAKK